ncbi:MAG: methyltransferase domain-containing protein [Betaproteobacteria bacterium]|nr:methyltransferase domain-containing protein [Betaproteobacteria bacterium]
MSLKHSYKLIAPFYDLAVDAATRGARARSLEALPGAPGRVLLVGVGTGLDLPLVPTQHAYVGLDLTAAMLRRARPRAAARNFHAVQGDARRLPFSAASFDHAVLHLILAVIPDAAACLAETARVVRPGGTLLVFDKFLRPGERAPLRRALNPLVRHIATRTDVVFEDVLAACSGLSVEDDRPALAGGWFRLIRLRRAA